MSTNGYINLFPGISENDRWNFRIINIVREIGLLPTIALTALLCCISCPLSFILDGYECQGSTYSLSAPNQRSCILGRAEISETGPLAKCPTTLRSLCKHKGNSSFNNPCIAALHTAWTCFRIYGRPFIGWQTDWAPGLCADCKPGLGLEYESRRIRLWMRLPVTLGLDGSWEELEKAEVEAF
ncbi:hypothetical protein BS17DRAFT_59612 [Gyrodon lividus]|nr:hypothetical protein BS17DRAFT_59612 [Gyrodon lividus]